MQKNRNIIIILFFILVNVACNAQYKETYWRITDIYREDKSAFKGVTGDYMQEILDRNFYFVKKGDSLYFEFPEKFKIAINNFKSLEQIKITDREYYEMYDKSFSGQTFRIRFRDNATMSDSRNTVIEFSQIPKDEFETGLEKAVAHRKGIEDSISDLKRQLAVKPQILLNEAVKLPQKSQVIQNDKGEGITLQIPREVDIKETGQIKTEKFGKIEVGTFAANSRIYDIVHPQKDYGLKQLSIWVSTDKQDFDPGKYVNENPNFVVFRKDNNRLIGYDLAYDFESGRAIINSFFCLKYYRVNNTHIFIYSNVFRSQFKHFDYIGEMNEILNFNVRLLENITVKK